MCRPTSVIGSATGANNNNQYQLQTAKSTQDIEQGPILRIPQHQPQCTLLFELHNINNTLLYCAAVLQARQAVGPAPSGSSALR
jgi:hypothetical protein